MRRTTPFYRVMQLQSEKQALQHHAAQHRESLRILAEEKAKSVLGPPKRRGRPPKEAK